MLTDEELKELYTTHFSLGNLGADIANKLALIALSGHLMNQLRKKKPNIKTFDVLKKLANGMAPDDFVKGVAFVVDDFSYACGEFPTFGVEEKKIPSKIREILSTYLPF